MLFHVLRRIKFLLHLRRPERVITIHLSAASNKHGWSLSQFSANLQHIVGDHPKTFIQNGQKRKQNQNQKDCVERSFSSHSSEWENCFGKHGKQKHHQLRKCWCSHKFFHIYFFPSNSFFFLFSFFKIQLKKNLSQLLYLLFWSLKDKLTCCQKYLATNCIIKSTLTN